MSGWRVYGLNNSSSQGSQVSCKVKIEGLDITKKYKMGKFSSLERKTEHSLRASIMDLNL